MRAIDGVRVRVVLCTLRMIKFIPLTFLLSILLVPGIGAAPSSEASTKSRVKGDGENPLPKLKQGEPAEVVKKQLGAPAEIRPMKAPSGTAEVWVYVKEISRRLDRIDRSTSDVVINVTEPDGSVRQKITPGQMRFEDVHYITEDLIEILMFNDHYVLHKITRQERKL